MLPSRWTTISLPSEQRSGKRSRASERFSGAYSAKRRRPARAANRSPKISGSPRSSAKPPVRWRVATVGLPWILRLSNGTKAWKRSLKPLRRRDKKRGSVEKPGETARGLKAFPATHLLGQEGRQLSCDCHWCRGDPLAQKLAS